MTFGAKVALIVKRCHLPDGAAIAVYRLCSAIQLAYCNYMVRKILRASGITEPWPPK